VKHPFLESVSAILMEGQDTECHLKGENRWSPTKKQGAVFWGADKNQKEDKQKHKEKDKDKAKIPLMTVMATRLITIHPKVEKHTNEPIHLWARKNFGVAIPNASIGGATIHQDMPTGLRNCMPNARKGKI